MRASAHILAAFLLAAAACGGQSSSSTPTAPSNTAAPPATTNAKCSGTSVGLAPLNELRGTYKGQSGGLYPGSNMRPASHEAAGLARAGAIVPRSADGTPAANGRYALVSIGMSNTTMEFQAFLSMATADSLRNPNLAIVDGAQGGQTAALWSNPSCQCWTVLDQRLAAANVSAKQVAIVWLKEADAHPTQPFPAHAQALRDEIVTMLQMLKARFPNLEVCYLSSRIYAGYASSDLNPEPYAYEGGIAVRWVIEKQLNGDPSLTFDPALGIPRAPWLSWGPYLWADGLTARSDGLTWSCGDFSTSDGTHPAASAQQKVAQMLVDFFHTDATARMWYQRLK